MEPKEKTAEVDIIKKHSPNPTSGYDNSWIRLAMKEYAAQETAQLRDDLFVERQLVKVKQKEKEMMALKMEQLREALKAVVVTLEWFVEEYPIDAQNLNAKIVIENARKLIQPNDSTQ